MVGLGRAWSRKPVHRRDAEGAEKSQRELLRVRASEWLSRVRRSTDRSVCATESSGSVEEVLAPLLVAVADQAHQLARGVQRERARAAAQLQSGFFGRAVAFAV